MLVKDEKTQMEEAVLAEVYNLDSEALERAKKTFNEEYKKEPRANLRTGALRANNVIIAKQIYK